MAKVEQMSAATRARLEKADKRKQIEQQASEELAQKKAAPAKSRKKIEWRETRQPSQGEDDWMATYADAITLLLAFFVVMLSMSEPKKSMMQEMQSGLKEQFGQSQEAESQEQALAEVVANITKNGLDTKVIVTPTKAQGFRIEIPSDMIFQPGSVRLKREIAPLLDRIAVSVNLPQYEGFKVEVQGHTDNEKPKVEGFPSNWEVSAVRAANVLRYISAKGVLRERLSAVGLADTDPKTPNLDLSNNPIPENQAMNRRIAIELKR